MNVAPATTTPSIATAAMLVTHQISFWEGNKTDKAASRQVTADNNARRGAARVNKLLIQSQEHDELKAFVATCRQGHTAATMPWSNSGLRLLTNAVFPEYHKARNQEQSLFYELVEDFLHYYPSAVSDAQARLGNLFNPDDYPTVEGLRRKFSYTFNYIPLPDAGDFRLDINNEAKQAMQEQYAKFYDNALAEAMQDIWHKLLKPLQNMSERLNYRAGEKPTGFRDTLVENVTDVVNIMKTCNVTGDPVMEQIRIDLTQALRGVTPDGLREDSSLRRETKTKIDNIIANLPSLG